jgi:hypothetical protein
MKTIVILLLVALVFAQVKQPGVPYSLKTPLKSSISTVSLSRVNVQKLLQEDKNERLSQKDIPPRVAVPLSVNINLENSGTWEKVPSGRLWRQRIVVPGAKSIYLIFDKYQLPAGATLFVIGSHNHYIGAFTSANNKKHMQFSTAPIEGEVVVLEYFEPDTVRGQGILSLSHVMHVYREVFSVAPQRIMNNASGTCNVNVACPEGKEWKDQVSSVAAVMVNCVSTLS